MSGVFIFLVYEGGGHPTGRTDYMVVPYSLGVILVENPIEGFRCSGEHYNDMRGAIYWRRSFRFPGHPFSLGRTVFSWGGGQFSF